MGESLERPADACVVWLHGHEETGSNWERLEADPMYGMRHRLPWVQWAFPSASGSTSRAPSKWFDYELPVIEAATEFSGIDAAVRTVHNMLDHITEANGIQPQRIVLGGFGPGGALALLSGRTYQKTLAGIIGLAAWYMRPSRPSSECGIRSPVLLCHGEDDDDVPVELHTEARARLNRDGVELTCHSYPGLGHSACATELTVLAAPKNFITNALRTLTPAPLVPRGAPRPQAHVDVPPCKLDARHAKGGAGTQTMADQFIANMAAKEEDRDLANDPTNAMGAQLIAATEAAQRESTACRLMSLSDEEGAIHVIIAIDGLSSLVEAELQVCSKEVTLLLPGAQRPFVVLLPRPVSTDGSETARYSKKTKQLTLTLMPVDESATGTARLL
mmetsp:Transcript_11354/g.29030  ORF Transcript_11354/g.29030 Transcript_11354/m.29030 type:complete len:389 (+) Transcript_11354:3-1169(+)